LATASANLWEVIAVEAEGESVLWASALRPRSEREELAVFSPLAEEGYLLHYGRPRLFAPPDRDTAILLGDYLYAHGLVRIAELDDVAAVSELAELLSVCAHLRAEQRPGDGEAWADTVARLGDGRRSEHAEIERALALHGERVL
jgi:hypothetical protein